MKEESLDQILSDMPSLPGRSKREVPSKKGNFQHVSMREPIGAVQAMSQPSKPKIEFGRLACGTRILASDRGGICSSIGMFVLTGSRFMSLDEAFLPHVVELMAFSSSDYLSKIHTLRTLEQLGAATTCRVGREEILYQVDALREYVPVVLPLMLANVICPSLKADEVEIIKTRIDEVQMNLQENPETLIGELVLLSAYQGNTLGNPLYAEHKDKEKITPERLKAFMQKFCTPDKLVLVGVNVDFNDLCRWTSRTLAELGDALPKPAEKLPHMTPAIYTGGERRIPVPDPLCHLMLAWEVEGGWNGDKLAAITVLQILLGGGGSFSTGGPGKGMHTWLYTQVLNVYHWVESCTASSLMFSDSGIFSVYSTVMPANSADFIVVLARIFQNITKITPLQLRRAKKMLKASIHMNLEMRAVLMEDAGRQLILSNKVGTAEQFSKMIDAITHDDLVDVLRDALSTDPTVIAYGAVESLPDYKTIDRTFKVHRPT